MWFVFETGWWRPWRALCPAGEVGMWSNRWRSFLSPWSIFVNICQSWSIFTNICEYLLFQNWKWWNSGWIIIYLFHFPRKQLLNRKRLGKVLTSEYSLLVSFRLFLHIHNIMLNIYIFVCLNIQYNLRIHTADKFFFVTYIKYLTSNFCISLGNCILICQYM